MKKFLLILFLLIHSITTSQIIKHQDDDGRTIRIPVVLHVTETKKHPNMHELITDSLIKKEISDLNKNFQAKNDMSKLDEKFKNLIGNVNIEFYLNPIDPIKRYTHMAENRNPNKQRARVHKPWELLNIVIDDFGSSSNVLVSNSNQPDRVNINFKSFGNSSNTVTHEVGHYLGLWHVWGKSNCKKIKFHKRTDYIPDTPKQNNCTDLSRKKQCPPKKIKKRANYNNFMDYSSCRCFFTKDQAQTIRNKIIKYKRVWFDKSL